LVIEYIVGVKARGLYELSSKEADKTLLHLLLDCNLYQLKLLVLVLRES